MGAGDRVQTSRPRWKKICDDPLYNVVDHMEVLQTEGDSNLTICKSRVTLNGKHLSKLFQQGSKLMITLCVINPE